MACSLTPGIAFIASLSVVFIFFPCLAYAETSSTDGGDDTRPFSPDLLAVPRTFNFVKHGERCIQAIAANETVEYNPPADGIPGDNRLPSSSFRVRGASCDTVDEAVYQLSAEVPPNGSMFDSVKAIVGEPDEFAGTYFFGNLQFDRKRQGPLCRINTGDDRARDPRDATLQKFMVASISESFTPSSDETLVPPLNKGSVYFMAIVRFVGNGYTNQLCIFESSAPSEVQTANSDADEMDQSGDNDSATSENSSSLSNAALSGIVLTVVCVLAIAAAAIIALARRSSARRKEKNGVGLGSESVAEGRDPDVYDTIDLRGL